MQSKMDALLEDELALLLLLKIRRREDLCVGALKRVENVAGL